MADRDEAAFSVEPRNLAGPGVAKLERHQALGLAAADELQHLLVPQHFDVGMREQAILEDLLGPQAVAAVDQSHIMAVVGHIDGFLDRGVAAADHATFLPR
jgi:hypothetical protein